MRIKIWGAQQVGRAVATLLRAPLGIAAHPTIQVRMNCDFVSLYVFKCKPLK